MNQSISNDASINQQNNIGNAENVYLTPKMLGTSHL